ncbi:hypothetical protein EPUL_006643, partial [Erysiphe pulchra]
SSTINHNPSLEACPNQQRNQNIPRRSPRFTSSQNESQQFLLHGIQIVFSSFLTNKERRDINLSKLLLEIGIIKTPGNSFDDSKKIELEGLMQKGVFKFVKYDSHTMNGIRLINSRLVNEVKGKTKSAPHFHSLGTSAALLSI